MLPVNNVDQFNFIGSPPPKLTKDRLGILEAYTGVTIGEKLELLLILLRRKWVGEVKFASGSRRGAEAFLTQLELASTLNFYNHSRLGRLTWLQVAANQAILDYVMQRRKEMTTLEAGMLYGYPISHCLAFARLIPSRRRSGNAKSVAKHYLAGIFSEVCFDQEEQYFEGLWSELTKVAPRLVNRAEDEWRKKARIGVS